MRFKSRKKFVIIAYDIHNDRNRLKVSEALQVYGTRINYSVFECMLTERQLQNIQEKIDKKIDKSRDQVVFYTICVDCFTKIVKNPERSLGNGIVSII